MSWTTILLPVCVAAFLVSLLWTRKDRGAWSKNRRRPGVMHTPSDVAMRRDRVLP